MTPEQLDEIETLAEAATPGPWKTMVDEFHADSGAHQVALHDCFSEQDAEKNAALIRAMRDHALPLVKALREARAVATRQTERLMQSEELTDQLHKERNKARAEVERLRSALRLLWEEAQDKCAVRDDTTDAVEAALKEGDR